MGRCSWLVVVYGLSCLLAQPGCTPARPHAADSEKERAGLRHVELGLCEDYPEETRSLAEVQRDFELLRAAGLDVLRISIGWDAVEPQEDRYDFAFWDSFVDLAQRAGITLIPYVAYTPEWSSDGPPESFWKTPPRDPAELEELMRLLAERYRGRIGSWEIWNEPDNKDYWLGDASQFATLLAAGAAGVRAGDPEARVVLGGIAGGVDFLRELFDQHGAAEHVDVVNLHGYFETWNQNPLETLPEYVGAVQEIVLRHGRRQPLWLAEIGYSNFMPPEGAPVAALYPYEHTLDFQAVMLVRTLALSLAEPAVSLIAWYELKDARPADAVIGDAHNRHLGVAFADHRPKPALSALSFVARLFEGGFRPAEIAVEARPGADVMVRAFVTAEPRLVIIAWVPTHPRMAPSASSGAALRSDPRGERVRLRVPFEASGPARRYDELGRPRGALAVRQEGGEDVLELELSGGGVEVVALPIEPER